MILQKSVINTRSITETVITLAITALFFIIFLGVLFTVFPIGGGLAKDSTRNGGFEIMKSAVRDILLSKNGQDTDLKAGKDVKYTAILTQAVNGVKNKRKDSVSWQTAAIGTGLMEGDSVLTDSQSKALITFDEKNFLNVGEKSLVVISKLMNDNLLSQRKAVTVMAEGEIWGRIEKNNDQSTFLEIATPNADTRIRGSSGQLGATEFKINVNPDATSSFVVFSGAIELESGGELVVVEENQQVTVSEDKVISAPTTLLASVQLASPRNNRRYYYRDLPPRINFNWLPREDVSSYRIIVSPDRSFRKTAVDTRTTENRFSYGNLRPGTYYWRVTGKDAHGVEGALGEVRKIHLAQDRTPPPLNVKFPGSIIHDSAFRLRGLTEPGAMVFVNEKRIPVRRNGEFNYNILLKPGVNLIIVESLDAAGNIAYQSHVVNGKFRSN